MKPARTAERLIEVLKGNEFFYTDGFEISMNPEILLDEHYRKAKAYDIVRFASRVSVEINESGNVDRAEIHIHLNNGNAIIDALNRIVFFVSLGFNDIENIYYDKADDAIGLFEELTEGGWENLNQM